MARLLLSGAVPGLLFGIYFAQLLFFLNPDLPFEPGLVARSWSLYGGLGAVTFGLLTAVLTWWRRKRPLRSLPWGITAALAGAGALFWYHASVYSYFLPAGINIRMIKAAVGFSVAALIGFYTALLHSVERRPYGWRSRVGFVLLAVLSVLLATERRGAFKPRTAVKPRPAILEQTARPSLLVVGLGGAGLEAILPLAEQGQLPFLAEFLDDGAAGHLRSLQPNRSLPLWASLDSGRLPHRHGILGDQRYEGWVLTEATVIDLVPRLEPFRAWATLGTRTVPVDADQRRVLPVWEVLARLGVPTAVIGWPGTGPPAGGAAPIIPDRFFADPSTAGETIPPEAGDRARLFRVRTSDLGSPIMALFSEPPPPEVLAALVEDRWRQSLAAFYLEQREDLGAAFLAQPRPARVSRRDYGGFSGAKFEGIQQEEFLEAERILTAYYRFVDRVLEELWSRLEEPRILAIVSPYGMEAPTGWRRARAALTETGSVQGVVEDSPDGIVLLRGTGIRPGARLSGAQILDVIPTLLYASNLPIARDLEGQVLRDAFEPSFLSASPLSFFPSYEMLREVGTSRSAGSEP